MTTTAARIADKLITLNVLRATAGKEPLKSWKNSEADLDTRIAEMTPTIRKEQPTESAPISPDLAAAIAASDVPVTVVPASPELRTAAKRKAVIEKIATDSVKNDTPTTVIDAKAAARSIRKETKKTAKAHPAIKSITSTDHKTTKITSKATAKTRDALAKASKDKVPTSKGAADFSAYLVANGITPKIARAKLRRAKVAKVGDRYELTDAVKAALASDARKK